MTYRTLTLAFSFALAACGNSSPPGDDGVLGGSLTVTGDVYDLQTQAPVSGAATVATTALDPAPDISVTGASFTLDGVPENSAFQILASAPPTHRSTYSASIEVVDQDVTGAKAFVVSEQTLAGMATGFGVTPSAANGILMIQLVDSASAPRAGVTATNIVLADVPGADGPHFLDASLAAAPSATSSTQSGWAVFFEVPPGVVSLGTAANATATLAMATAPTAAGTVTIAKAVVTDGAPPALPTNISFSQQVFPIFSDRGCVACHSGNGIGRDLGGLTLDGSANLVFKELTMENPLRAQIGANAEQSLVLTMPSAESPPDGHPNVTFAGPQDPDYIKILVWLREGAKDN